MVDLQVKPVGADMGTARPEARDEAPPKKQKTEVRNTNTWLYTEGTTY